MNKYLKKGGSYKLYNQFWIYTGDEGATSMAFAQSGVTQGDWWENITCYSCKETVHMKRDYPKERKGQMHVINGQRRKDENSDNEDIFTQDES